MIFSKTLGAATFALVASALPQPAPSSTTSSAPSSSSSSSASNDGSGSVNIINNLNETVYLSGSSSTKTLNSGGGSYTENWQTTSDGSGISIKMSTTQGENSVLQFEYTNDGETLFWDLSCIDLDSNSAFVKAGFSATPDDSSCSAVTCAAGDTNCAEAYQESNDEDTNSCSSGAGFTVTLG
ncbi:hypothetical protein BDW59DRAFT_147756 [Aspergillus cavernicola]|uniref:GPI anchored cell wall protein n=1 Tax=Aspergillus cavernicola TaxID=176166 RepID=A0ABR4I958_9EURO